MTNISVIGAGYVGLVTTACFAELGHHINLIEIDPHKVALLEQGIVPIYEPGLADLWERHWAAGKIHLTTNCEEGLIGAEFAFIAVGTPANASGKPNLAFVRSAAKGIAQSASGSLIVVNKSTAPIGTTDLVAQVMSRYKRNKLKFTVVSNPEFLREGWAVYDFFHPVRTIVGSMDAEAAQAVAKLYEPLGCRIIVCRPATAEMIKYASNAFLATKISFINEIAKLCDSLQIDVTEVAKAIGMDQRIGNAFLGAGLGWGGSCLPKDLRAIIYMAKSRGLPSPLLRAVFSVNALQPEIVVSKLSALLGSLRGKTVGILGLAFKPDSDDMRDAPSVAVISQLQDQGCRIRAYDPAAMANAAKIMAYVSYCSDAYEVATGSDALVLVTEWDEFRELDMKRIVSSMNRPIIIDGRNLYDPQKMGETGLVYEGIGRGSATHRQRVALSVERMETNLATNDTMPATELPVH